MRRTKHPLGHILFARIEGRTGDGSAILGRARMIGSLLPVTGGGTDAGVLSYDLTPRERGVYFVVTKIAKPARKRKGNRTGRRRGSRP